MDRALGFGATEELKGRAGIAGEYSSRPRTRVVIAGIGAMEEGRSDRLGIWARSIDLDFRRYKNELA
jgi:hypothetical protein